MSETSATAPPVMAEGQSDSLSRLARLREQHNRGEDVKSADILAAVSEHFGKTPVTMLPVVSMLTLQGKPYTLKDHFPFEPIFKLRLPRRSVWKCGRQVAKSTSLSASGVLRSACTRHLRTLFVTPRFEQVRRLSSNYVRPFIRNSLLQGMLVDESCTQHVLQRSFVNQSVLYFSFAFIDSDRLRGISSDVNVIDEAQDLDYDFIPIIRECLSASQLGISVYSGTPKTLDNSIEALWNESSKGEWVTKCSCGYWSMAHIHADLNKMMGKHTVVCAKCSKPINPRDGHWYHTDGEVHPDFHGYHIPQVIMPMHYENTEKWAELLSKREGRGGYTQQKFTNEVLGESADTGVTLISMTNIRDASVKTFKNDLAKACEAMRGYKVRVMGVDWGGGGEEGVSFTAVALVGLSPAHGRCDCLFANRFSLAMAHDEEAAKLLQIFRGAGCHLMAHDYGGSGSVRETLMIQAGLPVERILNFSYVHAPVRHIVTYEKPRGNEMRGYYSMDKSRSLVLMATCLKSKTIMLPDYESSKEVTHDLLNLVEEKRDSMHGSDTYLIRRRPKTSDDFAHALNFACMAIWHSEQSYPDLSMVHGIKMSEADLRLSERPKGWSEGDLGNR